MVPEACSAEAEIGYRIPHTPADVLAAEQNAGWRLDAGSTEGSPESQPNKCNNHNSNEAAIVKAVNYQR